MKDEVSENFNITQDGVLMMKGRVCVPNVEDLRKLIMKEANCFTYAMHPRSTKMYRIIKENYWWSGMKKDVAEYISRFLVCQQVTMDFVVGLPRTWAGYDTIWVIMD